MMAGGNSSNLPSLVDAAGRSYDLVQVPQRRLQSNNGQFTEEVTLVFRPPAARADPLASSSRASGGDDGRAVHAPQRAKLH